MVTSNNAITGARADIYFDDVLVGYAIDVAISEGFAYDAIRPLGHVTVKERVPLAIDVGGSATLVVLFSRDGADLPEGEKSLKDPAWGGTAGLSVLPGGPNDDASLLAAMYAKAGAKFALKVKDKIRDQDMFVVEEVVFMSRSMRFTTGATTLQDVAFAGRLVRDLDQNGDLLT